MSREAEQKAKRLADLLNEYFCTDQWYPVVWENLGWHYSVRCGSISVNTTHNGRYYALINSELNKPGGGLAVWTDNANNVFRSPINAVRFAMSNAQNYVKKLQETLKDNKERLNL